jgi:hypothetical protein
MDILNPEQDEPTQRRELAERPMNVMRNSLNTQVWSFRHPDFPFVSATHGTVHLALSRPERPWHDGAAMPRRLQVGTGVDFHADSDLDDARCFSGHDISPCDGMNMSRTLRMDSIDACSRFPNLLSDFSINEGGTASKSRLTHGGHVAAAPESPNG